MTAFLSSTLDKLREKFPADQVKQRQGPGGSQLDYVPIETVLGRLLDAAGGYSWMAGSPDVRMTIDGSKWVAIVSGVLEIDGKRGSGVGAMVHGDIDMAVKSANSEAMKNAAKNGFGVGLELWSEEHRATLATDRALAAADVPTMKKAVYDRAKEGLNSASPSPEQVADYFNVSVADLNKKASLKSILGL